MTKEEQNKALSRIDMDLYQRMVYEQFDDDGARNLAEAVVKRAALDWVESVRCQIRHKSAEPGKMRIDTEHFFLSGYFYVLTGLNGRWVLDKLKRQVGLKDDS